MDRISNLVTATRLDKIVGLCTIYKVAGWLDGNGVGHINEVALRWARLVLGWVTGSWFNGHGNLSRSNQPPRSTQPGHPSVGRRNEYWRWSSGHHQGRNVEFCVTVGPVTRTAGILVYSRLKAQAGDTLFQCRMHTFVPPDDSFRTKISPRMEYIIPGYFFGGYSISRHRPSGRRGWYAGLIGFKVPKRG